jgi:hypothetical protein
VVSLWFVRKQYEFSLRSLQDLVKSESSVRERCNVGMHEWLHLHILSIDWYRIYGLGESYIGRGYTLSRGTEMTQSRRVAYGSHFHGRRATHA